MSEDELVSIIAEVRTELAAAEKKGRFFNTQYEKYKESTPDVAALLKTLMESEVQQAELRRNELKRLAELQKRYAELNAKRVKK